MFVLIHICMYVFFNQVQNDCSSNTGGCLVQCGSLGRITTARSATMYWTPAIISALPGVLSLRERVFPFLIAVKKKHMCFSKKKKPNNPKPKCVDICNICKNSFAYQGLNSAFYFLCSQTSTLILKTEMPLSLALQDTLSKLRSILAW